MIKQIYNIVYTKINQLFLCPNYCLGLQGLSGSIGKPGPPGKTGPPGERGIPGADGKVQL